MGLAAFALATEIASPPHRAHVALLIAHFFSAGAILASLAAWLLPGWRWLTFFSALTSLVFMTTWTLVTESPQWLLMHGRKGDATAALAMLAFANKTRPPDHPLADPIALLSNTQRSFGDIVANAKLR
jgi:MFS family permease